MILCTLGLSGIFVQNKLSAKKSSQAGSLSICIDDETKKYQLFGPQRAIRNWAEHNTIKIFDMLGELNGGRQTFLKSNFSHHVVSKKLVAEGDRILH